MKPEHILMSDLLDIVFEHRNKAYGAYALRRTYPRRLVLALGVTCLLTLGLYLLQGLSTYKPPPVLAVTDFYVSDYHTPTELPETRPQEQARRHRERAASSNAGIVITPDAPETTLPTQDELSTAQPGKVGADPTGGSGADSLSAGGSSAGAPAPLVAPAPLPEGPLEQADVMPAFNGNLVGFMLRHLRQPDDLDDGERIVVRVRFVVGIQGDISEVELVQPGRPDLDQEVIRVVNKMPRWKPGRQGGRNVPVYFNLPVIFVRNGE